MCFLDDGMTDIPGLRGRNDGIMIGMVNDMRLNTEAPPVYSGYHMCVSVGIFKVTKMAIRYPGASLRNPQRP